LLLFSVVVRCGAAIEPLRSGSPSGVTAETAEESCRIAFPVACISAAVSPDASGDWNLASAAFGASPLQYCFERAVVNDCTVAANGVLSGCSTPRCCQSLLWPFTQPSRRIAYWIVGADRFCLVCDAHPLLPVVLGLLYFDAGSENGSRQTPLLDDIRAPKKRTWLTGTSNKDREMMRVIISAGRRDKSRCRVFPIDSIACLPRQMPAWSFAIRYAAFCGPDDRILPSRRGDKNRGINY
jgi:hypothetical protein